MTESLFFIGAGAAGGSLAVSLCRAGCPLVGVIEPNESSKSRVLSALILDVCHEAPDRIGDADIVFIAVPDPHIETVAKTFAPYAEKHQVWFHLSGALPADVLRPLADSVHGIGAFHPAQVFPPQDITPIPAGTHFGVSGDQQTLEAASRLTNRLSCTLVNIPDSCRSLYHAATVMASNAVAGLIATARELLVSEGVDKAAAESLLVHLAGTAVAAAGKLGLDNALSGPIQRGDEAMVRRHLEALARHPDEALLYRAVGKAIAKLATASNRTSPEQLATILSHLKI